MRRRELVLGIIIIIIAWTSPLANINQDSSFRPLAATQDGFSIDKEKDHLLSADGGVAIDWSPVIVVEMPGYSIPARGSAWMQMLQSEGIAASVVTVSELIANPTIIHVAPVILLDGSLGADDASHVPAALVSLLIGEDVSIVLTGRAAWLLHLLRGRGPPSGIALSNSQLLTAPGLEGAIYLSSPIPLSLGSSLTTEIPVFLPEDPIQTEKSRLIDLTGSGSSSLASLRYDSWPLETFLLGPEDPLLLTADGRGLVVNTIAYASVLRENSISQTLFGTQVDENSLLSGGYSYEHESTMAGTYYAVQIADALMDAAEWSTWKSARQELVLAILSKLAIDYGAETGFLTSATDGSVGCKSTAQGLWVLSAMDLSSQFAVPEIVAYLSSRQDIDGGFENHVTTTFHVIEALATAGSLESIDTVSVESWLRSCVIDGGKTSDPDLWGSIGSNPTSTSPTNQYAADYARALNNLGTTHNDPLKLTSWIITRTTIGDGSFRNTVGPSGQVSIGTGSALTTMASMGTLSPENRTTGMNWLAINQQNSGGYGLGAKDTDIVAKSKESWCVAVALNEMSETSSSTSLELKNYLAAIETDIGFELMDPLPSLMWNYWLATASRMNHATGIVDGTLQAQYLDLFSQWTQYPWWNNLTTVSAPEYGVNQYRMKSVWTQYFGVGTAAALGVDPSPEVVADALNFISLSQFVMGHFRPAMFIGTAHIQHSVAAVEALYLMDSLATIPYRSALESAMLSDYSGGQWSMTGWTIEPFAGEQAAIDWLCTRAGIRLGIIDATMAAQISASINTRIQYTDVYALSCDVATLALLNASGFSVNLESIDRFQVLNALGPMPYANGWLNATYQWQPVYTAESLEMVSILGLRLFLFDTQGSSLVASTDTTVTLGSSLDIDFTVISSINTHTVLVYAFGEWTQFTDVADSDTMTIDVPSDSTVLGPAEIYAVVIDWSHSRSYGMSSVEVRGILEGSLTIETPIVSAGSLINGTVSWTIAPGIDAGLTNITVTLGNSPIYQQWSYQDISPFDLHIPSTDFTTGTYNLTVILERQCCDVFALSESVDIVAPVNTYILSPLLATGTVDGQTYIDWSIHCSNGTEVQSQQTTLTIVDDLDQVVYTTQGISSIGGSVFQWTPVQRGNFSYIIAFAGNGSLVGSVSSGLIHVYEDTVLTWLTTGLMDQYSGVSLDVRLETSSGIPLAGYWVHVTVTTPSSSTVVDVDLMTDSTGLVSVSALLDENGMYDMIAEFTATGYLKSSIDSDAVNSWSESSLTVGGLSGDSQVGSMWDLWAQLADSITHPVAGESVTLRIILLPSTVVAEYTLTTNSTGHVKAAWDGNSAGSYRLEAQFTGTESRGTASDSSIFSLCVPVVLSLSTTQTPEVGIQLWIEVFAEDHLDVPIDGLSVTVTVRDPQGAIAIQQSGTTNAGMLQIAWIPLFRGQNNITATSDSQSWYEASSSSYLEGVYEQPSVDVAIPQGQTAPSLVDVIVFLSDYHGIGVSGVSVRSIITINGQLLLDVTSLTEADGKLTHQVYASEPGTLSAYIVVSTQGWLLTASTSGAELITGVTDLILTTPGMPIKQGTPVGIVVTLVDWSGALLYGAHVTIEVLWSNGTIVVSVQRITGADGKCTLAHDFNSVGDFEINASYSGDALNSSATTSALQRVYMIPNMLLSHSPSCMLGETLEIHFGITDTNQLYIIGRTLIISVEQNSIIVFETQVESIDGMATIHWDPLDRGIATITLIHAGNPYYFSNSTESIVSVLELVNAELILDPSSIDLFTSAVLRYTLLTAGTKGGILIHFEVLGLDLVPVWTTDLLTNDSGVAEVFYFADDSQGILTVRATPTPDQFLIGGDTQEQLNVMTMCTVITNLTPNPPTAGQDVNVTITVIDQLGSPIENLDVVVSLYDPLGNPVRLGVWSNSITVTTNGGAAIVTVAPTMTGLYYVHLSCSGATSVHGFADDTYHTVYSESSVAITVSETELGVGDLLAITVLLTDYQGSPMAGRNVTIAVDGPGVSMLGPIDVVTNEAGFGNWDVQLDDEGLWTVTADFDGLGVYLAARSSVDVSVRYGTEIEASIISAGYVVAGSTPASISVLLMDSGGTPLEGFTIDYSAYHDLLGLKMTDSVVQIGQEPIALNITLDAMGNYTILLSFAGTAHYHPSNAALRVWVYGTTNITVSVNSQIERSSDSYLTASFIDEVGSSISLNELNTSLDLHGPTGLLDLTSRLLLSEYEVRMSLLGLEVGVYTLNLAVDNSSLRVGSSADVHFDIVASTSISVLGERFSGIIGDEHELNFTLVDSLREIAEGATVFVSLYNPDGREILGSPLTTKTAYSISIEGVSISWVPSYAGNYSLEFTFEGSEYWLSANADITVLVRYPSAIQIDHPALMEYGQPIPFSITLSSGVFKIQDASLIIRVRRDRQLILEQTAITSNRGNAEIVFDGLQAGNLTFVVEFIGTGSFAPITRSISLVVTPLLILNVTPLTQVQVGLNCTLNIRYSILGVDENWNGELGISIKDPLDRVAATTSLSIQDIGATAIELLVELEGEYRADIRVSGLPAVGQISSTITFQATHATPSIPLDGSSVPWVGGLGIIAALAVLVRKRVGVIVSNLPVDWES